MPTVGVVMTCYNEGPYIEDAVRSVLTQTRADAVEKIVIVDDGSRDDTLAVLSRVAAMDPRIEILYERGNGPSKNRNLAAARCDADWLAMLDGDDLWQPEKLQRQFARAQTAPQAGMIYTGLAYFSAENPTPQIARVPDLSRAENTEVAYFKKDGPITSTILVRKRDFDAIGGYDETLRLFEDTDFYARLAAVTRFALAPEPLVHKRRHDGAATAQAKRDRMLAHQSLVTMLIAARSPSLIPLVPTRLARAARKLGNSEAADGHDDKALAFYRLARAVQPLAPINWLFWGAMRLGLPLGRIRAMIIQRRKARVS